MMKTLRNDKLAVLIDEATLAAEVTDLRTRRTWRMQRSGPGDLGMRGHAGPYEGMAFERALGREWRERPGVLSVTLSKWPYSANVWSPAAFGVTVTFTLEEDALRVELEPYRPLHGEISLIDSYYPRGFLFPEGVGGQLVLPIGQGKLLDKDYELDLDMVLPGWVGVGFVMPWFGQLAADGSGVIALSDTPDDLAFRIKTEPGAGVTVHPYWLPQLGALKYRRVMTYRFLESTGVLDMAKRYRRHYETLSPVKTLRERALERPNVEVLRGGIQLFFWGMSTLLAPRWSDKDRVAYMTFDEIRKRYLYFVEKAGFKKTIARVNGWGTDGYDFNHPDILPPDERMGGWEGLKALADAVHARGDYFQLHDNYSDYYMRSPAFKNQDGNMDLGGERAENCEWLGGRQQWLCAQKSVQYAKHTIDEIERHFHLDAIYIDCWTLGALRECFDQRHLSTRTMTKEAWGGVFDYVQRLGWLTSSESGNDWAVPVLDFIHAVKPDLIPFTLQGKTKAFGISIPLYAMVWHDCTTLSGWISPDKETDSVPEGAIAPQRGDMRLWTLLWGGMPATRTHHMDYYPIEGDWDETLAEEVAFLKGLQPLCDFSAKVGFEPITDWRMSADGQEQTAVFGEAGEVTVNFTEKTFSLKAGDLRLSGKVE